MLKTLMAASVVALASSVLMSVPSPVEAAGKSGYVSKCKKPERWNAVEGKCEKARPVARAKKAAKPKA